MTYVVSNTRVYFHDKNYLIDVNKSLSRYILLEKTQYRKTQYRMLFREENFK